MELKHIELGRLSVSELNMRGTRKACDIANILPSVRARGVLVPLIVRELAGGAAGLSGEGEGGDHAPAYEILAGKRRYHAALTLAEEGDGIEDLPCAVLEPGDDAAALEASLIENIARLDPDEMTRCETFVRLMREGRSVEDVAYTFGLTALQVKRTLALGNLIPRLRNLYRSEKIDPVSLRHLTMASRSRQREWLALFDTPGAYTPTGFALKAWLFGGASIPTSSALFDVEAYAGEIVADLFGAERYFASSEAFWAAQMEAVEARAADLREHGWPEVVVMPRGESFHSWEYEHVAKSKGGRVYIAIGHRGDVTIHEGYLTVKEARRLERGEAIEHAVRPEVSNTVNGYIDLHRHAAVRARLAGDPGLSLRVMAAHAIAGSPLWHVRIEDQRAPNDAVAESVEGCVSEAAFDTGRRQVLALLGLNGETPTVTGSDPDGGDICGLLLRLIALSDEQVMAVLAVVMGETLAVGTSLVDLLGRHMGVDMAAVWQADDALLDSIRDREVMGLLLTEVAGETVAAENAKAATKVQRAIIRDCLAGDHGRAKVEGWVPRWMAFPATAYTARGGVGSAERSQRIAMLLAVEATSKGDGDQPHNLPHAA
ncbi:ParB family chromosome partitioning protein [Novosphingobium sp. PhB165]|uniref:ParB/RepB/Spo0J family partition protein n=1 Tax=Novosphingobium sp. PhB165 TaxID=2485105 RepID=UPI00104444D1|nr:ParB N-terminal domain-containing protein [Novosphingobium sp. PhB165]TCM19050.1 ParB family chromosome partitioning protein [Novosphingobium sp. PhB165]